MGPSKSLSSSISYFRSLLLYLSLLLFSLLFSIPLSVWILLSTTTTACYGVVVVVVIIGCDADLLAFLSNTTRLYVLCAEADIFENSVNDDS